MCEILKNKTKILYGLQIFLERMAKHVLHQKEKYKKDMWVNNLVNLNES